MKQPENEQSQGRRAGGRPRKFSEPSRPITVTLPERTLGQLEAISLDRAKAIASAVEAVFSRNGPSEKLVEIVEVSPGVGMIIVAACRLLRDIPFLRLVEVAPTRCILSIPSGMSPAALEVALHDLLETMPESENRERAILLELHGTMRRFRRQDQVSKGEIMFVSL